MTVGAQFWFDLLKTFVQVRAAGIGLAGGRRHATTTAKREPEAQTAKPAKPSGKSGG